MKAGDEGGVPRLANPAPWLVVRRLPASPRCRQTQQQQAADDDTDHHGGAEGTPSVVVSAVFNEEGNHGYNPTGRPADWPSPAEYWQPYREVLDAIYAEIWTLRDGLPTVLVASDTHDAYLGKQQEAGIESQCRAWREAWSSVEAEAAVDHGAVMVSI